MSQTEEPRGLDRRAFLQLIGAAGLAAVVPNAAQALAAPAPAVPASPAPAITPQPAAPATPGDADKGPSDEAKALAAILRKRFPDRLTDKQWDDVTNDLDGRLASGKRLSATKLANGDEPDMTFKA